MVAKRLLCYLVLTSIFGCIRQVEGESPPSKAFYYPVKVLASASTPLAYVVSSNFDLKYNAGWVSVVDLDKLMTLVESNQTLTRAIGDEIHILSLAGLAFYDEEKGYLLVPHRGNPILTQIEVVEGGRELSCGKAHSKNGLTHNEALSDCDRAHLIHLKKQPLFAEQLDTGELTKDDLMDPFVITMAPWPDATSSDRVVAVGNLSAGSTTGRMLLLSAEWGTQATGLPNIQALRAVPLGFKVGIGSIVAHPDRSQGLFFIASSQVFGDNPRLSSLISVNVSKTLDQGADWVTRYSVNTNAGGIEMLGMTFSKPDLSNNHVWMYAANRLPNSLLTLEATIQPNGSATEISGFDNYPVWKIASSIPLSARPSEVLLVERPDGSSLIFVTSFEDDAVYVGEPQGSAVRVIGRLDHIRVQDDSDDSTRSIGRGPFSLAKATTSDGKQLLLITLFFDHALAVIDITPELVKDFRLVAVIKSSETEPAERAQ